MSEKMTDEELERTLGQIELGEGTEPVALLRAHIAALMAERDTGAEQLRTTHQQVAEVARLLDPEVCPDAWGLHAAARKVLAERDEWCSRATTAQNGWRTAEQERDALRERVRALEELAAAAELAKEDAESHLAAIRQRAGDEQALGDVVLSVAGPRFDVARAVARYIIGDDGPAEVKGPHKLGTNSAPASDVDPRTFGDVPPPSEMDGMRGEMAEKREQCCDGARRGVSHDDTCPWVRAASALTSTATPIRVSEMAEAPKGTCQCGDERCPLCCPPSKPAAPTTSEVFATVRDGVRRVTDVYPETRARIGQHLSLLEGRMGAMEAALRRLIRDAERPDSMPETTNEHGERMVRVQWTLVEGLRAALTGAPPVLTLEEVEVMERIACDCWWRDMAVRGDPHRDRCGGGRIREYLTTLRR